VHWNRTKILKKSITAITESVIEQAALEWLKDLGYSVPFGGDIARESTLASLRDGL